MHNACHGAISGRLSSPRRARYNGAMRLRNVLQRSGQAFAQGLRRPSTREGRNVRSVLIDGAGVGLVAGVSTFLPVFLARLGASPLTVSLLTAMPALTGIALALPVGRFIERQRNVVPWYSRSRVWVQGSYALTGLVPFFFPQALASIPIIVIWAIATVPMTIVNISFTIVMGAVAGPDKRYYLMSRRWSIIGVTSATIVALSGWFLDQVAFPLNYQLVFIASFVGGMVSFIFSSRISIPDNDPDEGAASPLAQRLREGLAGLRENPAFGRFVASQFVFRCGLTMTLPLFPLYWVRVVNASDSWIGVINTVNSGVLLVAYFFWTVVSRRRGNVLVLRASSLGLVFYPVLTALTATPGPLPLYAAVAGIFAAGIDLVLFDILLGTCPKQHAASYVALYQLSVYVATLVAPLVGTLIADAAGYGPAMFLAGGLRLAGFLLFVALGVGKEKDEGKRSERAKSDE